MDVMKVTTGNEQLRQRWSRVGNDRKATRDKRVQRERVRERERERKREQRECREKE